MRKNKKYKRKLENKNKVQQPLTSKKKEIQKKDYIIFKYGIGHLLFFQKYSNVFLVLKTESKQHVVTLTGGSCRFGRTRKQKISPFNISIMIQDLKEYCDIYKITRVRFFFKSVINKHYYNIMKYLALNNIKIMEIGYVLHQPHNGMRGRKLRRV
jgi:ribosomal protein S11